MASYESMLKIVGSSSELPAVGFHGMYAHAQDTNILYFWNGTAWVPLGSGGG